MFRLGEIKNTIEHLEAQVKMAETEILSSEDRVRQMDRAVEEQNSRHYQLTELVGRALAKKYVVSGQLDEARSIAKSLDGHNAVSDWSKSCHVV